MKNFLISTSIILFTITVTFAQEEKTVENVGIKKNAQADRPVKIIVKPKPKYPVDEGGSICVTGNVRVKVQFPANGRIGEVKAVSTFGYGLTENAIEAAKNIIFERQSKTANPLPLQRSS